jgi:hypothetical protein
MIAHYTYKPGKHKCAICGRTDYMCRTVPLRIQKFEVQHIDGSALFTRRYDEIVRRVKSGESSVAIAKSLNKRGYINSWGRPVTPGSIQLLVKRGKRPEQYDPAEYEAMRCADDIKPVWDVRRIICFDCAPCPSTLEKRMRGIGDKYAGNNEYGEEYYAVREKMPVVRQGGPYAKTDSWF